MGLGQGHTSLRAVSHLDDTSAPFQFTGRNSRLADKLRCSPRWILVGLYHRCTAVDYGALQLYVGTTRVGDLDTHRMLAFR